MGPGGRADAAYNKLFEQPGYSPEQQQQILQDNWGDFSTSPEMRQAYLDRVAAAAPGLRGNPNAPFDYYNPDATRGLVDRTAGGLQDTLKTARGNLDTITGQLRSDYNAAIDPARLRMAQETPGAVRGLYGTAATNVRGAINPQLLGLSDRYQQKYDFTDQDVADTAAASARAVGAAREAAIGDIERRAAAAGETSPLAMAAVRDRFENAGAADAGDAAVRARLLGKTTQMNAEQQREATRLGAQQYLTGTQVGSEMGLAGMGIGAEMGLEGMRLGAEQGLTDRYMRAAQDVGQTATGNERFLTQGGLQAQEYSGSQALQNEQLQQEIGQMLAQGADDRAVARAAQVLGSQQAADQYVNNLKWQQGLTQNTAMSQRYGNIANTERQGEQAYRDYLTNVGSQFGNRMDTNEARRLQAVQLGISGSNAATQGATQWDMYTASQPSVLSRIGNAATGALAGFAMGGPIGAGIGAFGGAVGSRPASYPRYPTYGGEGYGAYGGGVSGAPGIPGWGSGGGDWGGETGDYAYGMTPQQTSYMPAGGWGGSTSPTLYSSAQRRRSGGAASTQAGGYV